MTGTIRIGGIRMTLAHYWTLRMRLLAKPKPLAAMAKAYQTGGTR